MVPCGQSGAPENAASGVRILCFFEGALSESFGRGPRALESRPGVLGRAPGGGRGEFRAGFREAGGFDFGIFV